ncbi:hypothetical protein ACOQFV_18920 [Nocardiopsis changdeensis]|uniref:hypothetical protein n=1 Tax=Nocardiopsis TaxID=2013 RepID=UPI001C72AB8D|nr:hypothetical protein [Nocardiopsis sp. MT53]QYX39680.1 hypothetical protein K1J57_14610 [Nocardiopsis sp. MT53]
MANGTVARSTARLLERRHVTRAGMSRIAVMVSVGAAVWFTRPDTVGGLAGSAFLVAVLFCDSVRERMRAGRYDALTLWLSAMLSQLREYIVYLGLAVGAVLAGAGGAWGWAAGALVALALRDALLVAREAPPAPPVPSRRGRGAGKAAGEAAVAPAAAGLVPRPATGGHDRDGAAVPSGHRTARPGPRPAAGAAPGDAPRPRPAASAGQGARRRAPAADLARRLLAFPQPVRFLAIAVTATLWDPRISFVTLIVGCAIAITTALVDPAAAHGGRR